MKPFIKTFSLFLFTSCPHLVSTGQDYNNDSIYGYFNEIKTNCSYFLKLWDLDLYGPILLVDPKTRIAYSNYPDSTGILREDGNIYKGILPDNINTANTAIKWSGRSWAMIMLPLPENRQDRLDLVSHELFHRSQSVLGFKMSNAANNHLDRKDGRVYLRLELEALRQALFSDSESQMYQNLGNALYFRSQRYSAYPDAKANENLLELNEGLATYTGIVMSGRDKGELRDYFENKIAEFQNNPTFVRSFAYLTLPLYGTLLRNSDNYWNKLIDNNTVLPDFFLNAFKMKIPEEPDTLILDRYGYNRIIAGEKTREEKINQLISEYKVRFIEQSHLEIRLEKMSVSFDPRNLMPVEGYGTVYPTLRVSDNWGVLTVSDGALLGTNWDKITVSEPTQINKDKVIGDGWTIDLNSGYYVVKNGSDKNYSLKKQ